MATQPQKISDTFLPEIILGIVSPVGTDLSKTLRCLKAEFEKKGFVFHHIKLSNLFPSIAKSLNYNHLDSTKKYNRTDTYIKFGNFIRDNIGSKSLSVFSLMEIAEKRASTSVSRNGIVYVVDQLKTEDELDLLKEIYGNRFLQISVYSARDVG